MNAGRLTVGIVDYGVGNHTSVLRCVRQLGFRSWISPQPDQLDQADVLLLPGVGAFPAAMERLHASGLVDYLQGAAQLGRPLIGICLGMQLLAESSTELGFTPGLGLIPGAVEAIGEPRWHIGWNSLEVVDGQPLLHASDGEVLYFNHSYAFRGRRPMWPLIAACAREANPWLSRSRGVPCGGCSSTPRRARRLGWNCWSALFAQEVSADAA